MVSRLTPKRFPRRGMYRKSSSLRKPSFSCRTRTSTREPFTHFSIDIQEKILCHLIFAFFSGLFGYVFLLIFYDLTIPLFEFEPLAEFIFSIGTFGFFLGLGVLFAMMIQRREASLKQTSESHKATNKFCNYLCKQNRLNCGVPLSLMSESLKSGDQSLYRETSKEKALSKATKKAYSENSSCHICGYIIDIGKDTCHDCGTKRIKCSICKQYLNYDDDIAYCFFCETNFHFSHLMEWIKIRGKCPTCKKRLLMSEVVRRYTYEE